MRKKILAILCAAAILVTLLAGCGGSGASMDAMAGGTMTGGTTTAPSAPGAAMKPGYGNSTNKSEAMYDSMEVPKEESGSTAGGDAVETTPQKLIYTATLEMETTAFDDSVAELTRLVSDFGGYFSTNNVRNYGSGYRSADFTIRIPADKYEAFLAQAGELCHVLRRYSSAEDVSEQYYDIAGRLKTQQTKLARLQELLTQAKNMEDIITIESAISQTEEQIEYLSGTLRHYDALVDYSTVHVNLNEVYRLSNTEEPVQGFGSRFLSAFKSGWADFVDDMEDLLIDLAYSWMWVLIWAVVIVVVIFVARRKRKNRGGWKLFRRKEVPKETYDEPDVK